MSNHPNITPASSSLASSHFDASFDSIESLTTTFTSPVVPTLETTTVTEVALGYHRNQQYSITAMTTSSGAVAERYAYTAYGQPTILNASGTVLTSSAVGNRYTYTGREWDETLGLHHFRARWMSPLAGRFLGRDPIGYQGSSFNVYEFLESKSLDATDPSGLWIAPPFMHLDPDRFQRPRPPLQPNPRPPVINLPSQPPIKVPVRGDRKIECGRFVIVGSCSTRCGDPDITTTPAPGVTLTLGPISLGYTGGGEITCPGSPGQTGPGEFTSYATAKLCQMYEWGYDWVLGRDDWLILNAPWIHCAPILTSDTRKCCAKQNSNGSGGGGTGGNDPRPYPDPDYLQNLRERIIIYPNDPLSPYR